MRRKIVLLVAGFMLSLPVSAQITLGAGDFATAGLHLKICQTPSDSTGAMNSAVSLGSPGANGTYNISGAAAFINDTLNMYFVTPSVIPNPGSVQAANVAAQVGYTMFDITGDTLGYYYIYMNSNNNGLWGTGLALNWDTALFSSLTPNQPWGWTTVTFKGGMVEMMSSNFALGYTLYDSVYTIANLFNWPVYRVDNLIKTTTIDGWGTLTTPVGTYQVLRGKSIYRHHQAWTGDTNNITWEKSGQENVYEFYAKGIGFPVAMIGYRDATFTDVEYIKYVTTPPAGISESRKDELKIYPSVASDYIYISGAEGEYFLSDLNGKILMQGTVQGKPHVRIPVSELPAGIYHISLTTDNERLNGRFIKQ